MEGIYFIWSYLATAAADQDDGGGDRNNDSEIEASVPRQPPEARLGNLEKLILKAIKKDGWRGRPSPSRRR